MIIGASGGSAPEWFDDQQRAAVGRHVLDALQLDPEPVAVVEVEDRLGELEGRLRPAPVVDLAARLRRRDELARATADPAATPALRARSGRSSASVRGSKPSSRLRRLPTSGLSGLRRPLRSNGLRDASATRGSYLGASRSERARRLVLPCGSASRDDEPARARALRRRCAGGAWRPGRMPPLPPPDAPGRPGEGWP